MSDPRELSLHQLQRSQDVLQTVGSFDQTTMTGQIAAYVTAARGLRTSGPAREAAFRCILDLLGAAVAGLNETAVVAVRKMTGAVMGTGSVPIWFSGQLASAVGAAWANSAAAAALDIDDGHRLARGHPGAAVIPAVFAVAHEVNASLEDILTAIVIGYEVGVTVSAARTTYGNTGTWSAYAVTAAAAALRGTPQDILAHALAIAGESGPNQLFASAPSQVPPPEGSDVKEGIPWSVVTGLVALGLAEAGHTGPRNILNSARHYKFADGPAFGSVLHICRTYHKLYSCCRHVHAPLDAFLHLIQRHGIDIRAIEKVEVETYGGALRISNKTHPDNLVDIQYSIPYCLALAAIAGPQALLPLTPEALALAHASDLAARVSLSIDPEFDARFPAETLARVTILSRGERYVSEPTAPQGEASNPLSWGDLETKFREVTRLVATEAQNTLILNAMNDARDGRLSPLISCLVETDLRSAGQNPSE